MHSRKKGAGIQQRLREYFAANPDEELTRHDAITKFECSENHLDKVLRQLRDDGFIETVSVFRMKARND